MKRTSCFRPDRAFTFIGLLFIIFILAILAALLLPALAKAKGRAQRINCVNNLKQVGIGFRIWGGDHGDNYPMFVSTNKQGTLEWVAEGSASRHFQVMAEILNTPKILVCPTDNRPAATSFSRLDNWHLSYFVGLDAQDTQPQMLLSGDRNLTNGLAPVRTILMLPPDRPAGWTEAMHNCQGNIGLADGSVQPFTTDTLRTALRFTGNSTNRIALPE